MADEMNYIDIDTITIPLEDGTDLECAILDEFEAEGRSYIVLAPVEGDELGDETFLYRYSEDGDDIVLDYIEDEDELKRVTAIYEEILAEFDED